MKALLAALVVSVVIAVGYPAEVSPAPSRQPSPGAVEVTLVSDGETWVSITKVQVPAKFQTKKFNLPPGDYEVVGRRKGYRDVEKSLQVRSGTKPITLTVICTVDAFSQ